MRSVLASVVVVWLLTACGGGETSLQVKPMPEGGNFTGVYFSPQYGEMHIVQNGSAAHGKYEKDERTGKLQGEVEGNTMRFEWTEYKAMVSNRPNETRGQGYFQCQGRFQPRPLLGPGLLPEPLPGQLPVPGPLPGQRRFQGQGHFQRTGSVALCFLIRSSLLY